MTKRACARCGKRGFSGEVEGIRLTTCCEACCRKFVVSSDKLYAGWHRLPEAQCRRFYNCSLKDLSELNSTDLYYPCREKSVRFYLGAEVECLGKAKVIRRRRTSEIMALGIKLKKMDPVLLSFLVGDYVRQLKHPSTSFDEIQQRCKVLERVKRIRRADKGAHPGAVFDFCIQYPDGKAADFMDLKERAQRVFRLEGDNIMRRLTKSERSSLLDTPLKDVVEQFNNRDKKAKISFHLKKWVPPSEAAKIIDCRSCQLRIAREEDELEIAQKLLKFWMEKCDDKTRREHLLEIAREKKMPILTIGQPLKTYVYGYIDCDPEEVVGVEQIANHGPFTILSYQRGARISMAVTRFEECLCAKQMTYDASIVEAIEFARRVPLPADRSNESFDFNWHATGLWSHQWYKL